MIGSSANLVWVRATRASHGASAMVNSGTRTRPTAVSLPCVAPYRYRPAIATAVSTQNMKRTGDPSLGDEVLRRRNGGSDEAGTASSADGGSVPSGGSG